MRYKRLVKGVANDHGMQACFMAKPFGDLAGSGMHMHVSAWPMREGNNLFASEDPARHAAAASRHRRHARQPARLALPICSAPTPTPTRRFQANSYAPLAKTWGVDNRTVSLRVPGGPAKTPACRAPYLWRRRQPLPGGSGDPGRHPQGHPRAARSGRGHRSATAMTRPAKPTHRLVAVLRNLEGSAGHAKRLGEDFLRSFLAIKSAEYSASSWAKWASRIGLVSEYLPRLLI